jgi:hypothetical protein
MLLGWVSKKVQISPVHSIRCDYKCVAAIPQPAAQWGTVSAETLAFMHDFGVRSVPITNRINNENYPIGNKLACLGIDTPTDKLIFLDSDILCLREFSPDTIPPTLGLLQSLVQPPQQER